jgi:DNA polymerase-3 subunit delta
VTTAGDMTDLKTVYLIWGSEDVLLDRAVDRLRSRLAQAADLDFNLDVFDAESTTADDVVAAANTMPFMSERRLVVLRRADKFNATALNVLAEYAEDPSPSTVLVLVAAKVDKRTRLYKAVDKKGQVAEYAAPKRGEYPSLVQSMFKARGVEVSRDAAQALIGSVGSDLRRLSTEADKIVAFVGAEGTVDREQVVDIVANTAPVPIWALADALSARDLETCIRVSRTLEANGESPHRLQATGVRHVRGLLAAKALSGRGAPMGTMMSQLRMPDWKVRNTVRDANRFETTELIAALRAAARSEAEMKTSPVAPGLVLERWMATVCRATP